MRARAGRGRRRMRRGRRERGRPVHRQPYRLDAERAVDAARRRRRWRHLQRPRGGAQARRPADRQGEGNPGRPAEAGRQPPVAAAAGRVRAAATTCATKAAPCASATTQLASPLSCKSFSCLCCRRLRKAVGWRSDDASGWLERRGRSDRFRTSASLDTVSVQHRAGMGQVSAKIDDLAGLAETVSVDTSAVGLNAQGLALAAA